MSLEIGYADQKGKHWVVLYYKCKRCKKKEQILLSKRLIKSFLSGLESLNSPSPPDPLNPSNLEE